MLIATSNLLSKFDEIKIFISTKIGGNNAPPYYFNLSFSVGDDENKVKENRKQFFDAIKIKNEEIAFQRQTHSDNVLIVEKPGIYNDCDALITQKANVYLAVSVADCVPIFMYDHQKHIVSVVHSGWKGSVKKILTKTINIMKTKFNSNPKDIYSYIGYSAGICCYEVGKEVAINFDDRFIKQKDTDKYNIDLKGYNYSLLINEGVPKENIEMSELCTICNPNILHSYRRDGLHSGRMIGIIGLTK